MRIQAWIHETRAGGSGEIMQHSNASLTSRKGGEFFQHLLPSQEGLSSSQYYDQTYSHFSV